MAEIIFIENEKGDHDECCACGDCPVEDECHDKTILMCRRCGNLGYYKDIRDDRGADKPDYKFGTCGECDPPTDCVLEECVAWDIGCDCSCEKCIKFPNCDEGGKGWRQCEEFYKGENNADWCAECLFLKNQKRKK